MQFSVVIRSSTVLTGELTKDIVIYYKDLHLFITHTRIGRRKSLKDLVFKNWSQGAGTQPWGFETIYTVFT